jgi:hypothetical protein
LKALPQDSRGCERRSPEGAKGFVWATFYHGTHVDDVSEFFYFNISEDKRSRLLSRKSRSHETAKESELSVGRRTCVAKSPISGIQTSEVRKRNPSTLRVEKW